MRRWLEEPVVPVSAEQTKVEDVSRDIDALLQECRSKASNEHSLGLCNFLCGSHRQPLGGLLYMSPLCRGFFDRDRYRVGNGRRSCSGVSSTDYEHNQWRVVSGSMVLKPYPTRSTDVGLIFFPHVCDNLLNSTVVWSKEGTTTPLSIRGYVTADVAI